jgi:hypothetical protein
LRKRVQIGRKQFPQRSKEPKKTERPFLAVTYKDIVALSLVVTPPFKEQGPKATFVAFNSTNHQHIFRFFDHPKEYIPILPGSGIINHIVLTFSGKPVLGYLGMVYAMINIVLSLIVGGFHLQPKWKPSISWFKNAESCLNHHLSRLFGVSSLAWTGHLVHVAIPGSRENTFDGIIS